MIDNPTMLPAWVRDAAEILKGNVDRYVFISTISVFADNSKPGMDESGSLLKYEGADPMKEDERQRRCFRVQALRPVEGALRAGSGETLPQQDADHPAWFDCGAGDESDRFTYWPVRIDRGGEVLAPRDPKDPVQMINARDLAEWTIRMAENRETGIYNATGPATPLTIGSMLDGIKNALNARPTFTWADAKFLEAQKVEPWSDMPVWVPPQDEMAGFALLNVQRAIGKGLTFRPLTETTRDTLAWFKVQPKERQAKLHAGLTPEREAEVLAAWHKQQPS